MHKKLGTQLKVKLLTREQHLLPTSQVHKQLRMQGLQVLIHQKMGCLQSLFITLQTQRGTELLIFPKEYLIEIGQSQVMRLRDQIILKMLLLQVDLLQEQMVILKHITQNILVEQTEKVTNKDSIMSCQHIQVKDSLEMMMITLF